MLQDLKYVKWLSSIFEKKYPYFLKKATKVIKYWGFSNIWEKKLRLDFEKEIRKKHLLVYSANLMPEKVIFLEIQSQIPVADQIAGFC